MNTYRILIKMKPGKIENSIVGHVWQPCGDPVLAEEIQIDQYMIDMRLKYLMFDIMYELIATRSIENQQIGKIENLDNYDWNEELNKLVEEEKGRS